MTTKQKSMPGRSGDRIHSSVVWLALYDMIVINLAYFLALWLRCDCKYSMIPHRYLENWAEDLKNRAKALGIWKTGHTLPRFIP